MTNEVMRVVEESDGLIEGVQLPRLQLVILERADRSSIDDHGGYSIGLVNPPPSVLFVHFVTSLVLCLILAATASAQTDPRSLPRFDPASIVSLGKVVIPSRDSQGALINYGGGASGISEDGTKIFVACNSTPGNNNQTGRGYIWTGTIPAMGGISQEVAPCTGLSAVQLQQISGNPGSDSPLVGSVFQRGGRFIVGGYITYDASGNEPRKTWWVGPSLASLVGPVEGSVRNGLVKGNTSPVPPVWQTLLGGDMAVGDQFSSIISRGSYGAAFTTFYSKDVGTPGFAMHLLLGCPAMDPATGAALPQCTSNYTEGTQSLTGYQGSEKIAATFIVPGTRTLMVVLREARGPMCYGYATTDKTLHGTIKPGPEGVHWCYSLSGDPNQKGMHGYPYVHLALSFDLADLVEVKQGRKKPWDVVPYSTHVMPGSRDDFDVGYRGSGAFNPMTGQYYLMRELYPNGQGGADVEVWGGWPKDGGAPPPVDCVEIPGDWGPGAPPEGWTAWSDAGSGKESRHRERTWTQTVKATVGGAACVWSAPDGTPGFERVFETRDAPPVNVCVTAPLVVTVSGWPGVAEGSRSLRYSATVAGVVVQMAELRHIWAAPQRLIVTDARGCSATVQR